MLIVGRQEALPVADNRTAITHVLADTRAEYGVTRSGAAARLLGITCRKGCGAEGETERLPSRQLH
jgi:hypothetical protein